VSLSGIIPASVGNWIGGRERPASGGATFEKRRPTDGSVLSPVARSSPGDVDTAVAAARGAFPGWARTPGVRRGELVHELAMRLRARRDDIARVVAAETGKSLKLALGETDGAIALGTFMAGEGQRLYGRTTTSGVPNKWAMTMRRPIGVAGLIGAANTPIANVAWKLFPALICGNTVVLKAAEDTPLTAWIVGQIAQDVGFAAGVINIVQGIGAEAGARLVEHPDVAVISFTGSTRVGREIAQVAGKRMARVSLELGGKNPFVVCDDADLDNAVRWVLLSAFSNAGQRCASGSRVIVFDAVYDRFRDMLVAATKKLRVGPGDDDDFGPVINERQLMNMLGAVEQARARGAVVLTGGERLTDATHRDGYYLAPTLVENVPSGDEMSHTELFGPITTLYRVAGFAEAVALANDSPYGLTACIHTRSIHRALEFAERIESGVVSVNAGTHGSEPHMPFGGVKQSGNGSREPGTEALDVYSNLQDVYLTFDPAAV
jgi:aldehyde dehydrogenase (NAD+)